MQRGRTMHEGRHFGRVPARSHSPFRRRRLPPAEFGETADRTSCEGDECSPRRPNTRARHGLSAGAG